MRQFFRIKVQTWQMVQAHHNEFVKKVHLIIPCGVKRPAISIESKENKKIKSDRLKAYLL